ncbi:MAG: type III-B CRISPR module RAMP protein Cmr4 [Candidatus Cloacimonadaceae bacterium]|jgi:CRISPR-associated protein Cmr4|nr:type III-B CRISPR module RAMP protein Cmr4 [Candidatus Syntrophosphaera sp.]
MNEPKKYFGIALDPIHIGAGGYRLGRVDNTIVREPATDVPKIPGTSLAGVIREFATIVNKTVNKTEQDNEDEKIMIYFGNENKQGMVRFYDGQIIFFPVSSIQGTVWITTKELLINWLGKIQDTQEEIFKIPDKAEDKAYCIKGFDNSNPLNLGWLLLEIENNAKGKEIIFPPKLNDFLVKIVVVSSKLFSHIVNDNLEVRTSVRIDPKTGTAVEGALFTFEAIPRGTILGFEIAVDSRKGDNVNDIINLIENTFPYLKLLGLGGMGTRGFGRIEILEINNNSNKSTKGEEINDKS